MHIFLDDERMPGDVTWLHLPSAEWTIVRNYEEFVTLLKSLEEAPKFVAFDHDLAAAHYLGDFSNPNEKTGLHCARALFDIALEKGWNMPKWTTHSLNPSGRENINGFLNQAKSFLTGDGA
jgi:hypothetical protein